MSSLSKAQARDKREQLIKRLVRPEVRQMSAYHVPDPAGLIKLDAMENPYSWPPALRDAWLAELRDVSLNRYPDPAARALVEELRRFFAIPADYNLLLGNGSDELIQMLALAVGGSGAVMLGVQPGFSMFRPIALATGMRFVGVPLRDDGFGLDVAALQQAIEQYEPRLAFLACPNNPTGNLFDEDDICAVIEAMPGLVVIDEAYEVFAGQSFMHLLDRYPNLLIMRTLSKIGLAGLRLGLLIGAPAWLAELDKIRLPYNINVLTQASAAFALRQATMLRQQAAAICAERERLQQAMSQLPGLRVFPSRANFILFRAPAGRARPLQESLKAHGVLIKNLDGEGGVLADCLRVTVGQPDENSAFLVALTAALAA
jgi:histidinol-phosphate aminotransferase